MKALRSLMREETEGIKIPRSVQEVIPIQKIWEDGVIRVSRNRYSYCFKFTDINYAIASKEDREAMFLKYCDLLNSLDTSCVWKLTMQTRKANLDEVKEVILIKHEQDGLDNFRDELNDMMLDKLAESDFMVQDKFLTCTVSKKNVSDARTYFKRISADLTSHFTRLGSMCKELDGTERLQILHAFYRAGEEVDFNFDFKDAMKKGHSFKDYICPDTFGFRSDHFEMGKKYGRTLFLKEYASFIKDSFLSEMIDFNRNLIVSVDIIPISTDEAVKEAERRSLSVETEIANYQRRQNQNNNFSAIIPYDLELQRKETKEFLHDLTSRDQRMMFATMTIVHTADTKEQLDDDTEVLETVARKNLCQLGTLKYQQMDGLNSALPIGVRNIKTTRTLTTESLAVFIPFRVQEIFETGGMFFGQNALSNNLLICNKGKLINPNAFLLGIPGAGKSFLAKLLIAIIILATDDDVLVCDPEGEYTAIIEALNGEVIKISATSNDHINAMDMVAGYGEGSNPLVEKSQFILSLFEQLDSHGINAKEKSIIDRCLEEIYTSSKESGKVPTLVDLYDRLLEQDEPIAHDLALSLELFTKGSLNAFAHETNVDVQNRVVSYDIMDLGSQLKTMGLLVITDAMLNRVTENWRKGKRTHIFIDEFHVVFENEHSGQFFNSAWRRFRKRNAFPTAITQNVEYLLDSVLASTMLSNSEMVVMLNQAPSDRLELAKLLNISTEQLSYITNAESGCGLMKYGSSLIPFKNNFPKNTELYRLMSTKPNEVYSTPSGDDVI